MPIIDTSFMNQKKEKKAFVRLPKTEVFKILKDNLPSVIDIAPDKILDGSKYVRLARDYGYNNYKLCSWADIKRLGIENSFTTYQKQFFADAGACVAVFNEFNGKLFSIVFRSVSAKDFMDYSLSYNIYGLDNMDPKFKYGDHVILTEGIYDADSFRHIYPNTVAMLTSNITIMQSEVLKTMTDKFIVAFDDDKAGDAGFTKAIQRLGTDIKKLQVFPGDKDLGVMEEQKVNNPLGYAQRVEYYKEKVEECLTTDGFYL